MSLNVPDKKILYTVCAVVTLNYESGRLKNEMSPNDVTSKNPHYYYTFYIYLFIRDIRDIKYIYNIKKVKKHIKMI